MSVAAEQVAEKTDLARIITKAKARSGLAESGCQVYYTLLR